MNVINSVFSSVSQITSNLFSIAFEMDPRIRNIVQGAFFVGSGFGLMIKSLHKYTNINMDAQEQGGVISTSNKVTPIAMGLIGTGFVAYGAMQVVAEFMDYTKPQNYFSPICENRLKAAKEELETCPLTQNLWAEAEEMGPISFKCDKQADPNGKVMWDFESRTIFVHPNAINIAPRLVQALSSLQHPEVALQITEKACNVKPKEFARFMEMNEYLAIVKTYGITKECIDQGKWPEMWGFYRDRFENPKGIEDWTTVPNFLKSQEATGHTRMYEEMWEKNCGKMKGPKSAPVLKEYL